MEAAANSLITSPYFPTSPASPSKVIPDHEVRKHNEQNGDDPRSPTPTEQELLTNLQILQQYFAYIRRRASYGKFNRLTPVVIGVGTIFAKIVQSREFHYVIRALSGGDGSGTANSWLDNPNVLRMIGTARFAGGIVAGVVSTYTIGEQIAEIVYESDKGRLSEGADAILRLIEGIAGLCDSVSLTASGLTMAEVVGTLQWVNPLALASAIISVATLILEIKGIVQAKGINRKLSKIEQHLELNRTAISDYCANFATFRQLERERLRSPQGAQEAEAKVQEEQDPQSIDLSQLQEKNPAKYQEFEKSNRDAWNWLRDEMTDFDKKDGDFYIRRHFGILNREQYNAQILYIIDGMPGSKNIEDGAEPGPSHVGLTERVAIQRDLAKALQGRISDRIASHYVGIISAIVGLIGVTVLFYLGSTSGGLSTGLGLVAFSAFISAIKYFHHKRSVERLEKWLNENCPFEAIPDWYLDPKEGPSWLEWHNKRTVTLASGEQVENRNKPVKGPAWSAYQVRHFDYGFDIGKIMGEISETDKTEIGIHFLELLERQTEGGATYTDKMNVLHGTICRVLNLPDLKKMPPQEGKELMMYILDSIPPPQGQDRASRVLQIQEVAQSFVDHHYFIGEPRKTHYNPKVAKMLGHKYAPAA